MAAAEHGKMRKKNQSLLGNQRKKKMHTEKKKAPSLFQKKKSLYAKKTSSRPEKE